MDKLYTRCGDSGTTSTANCKKISKGSQLIELLGTTDELSAAIALARAQASPERGDALNKISRICSALMCEIAGGKNADDAVLTAELEQICDSFSSNSLACFADFRTEEGSRINLARTIARRAERCAVHAAEEYSLRTDFLKILNRISDALFAIALDAEK